MYMLSESHRNLLLWDECLLLLENSKKELNPVFMLEVLLLEICYYGILLIKRANQMFDSVLRFCCGDLRGFRLGLILQPRTSASVILP
jgi:hypothetical protein